MEVADAAAGERPGDVHREQPSERSQREHLAERPQRPRGSRAHLARLFGDSRQEDEAESAAAALTPKRALNCRAKIMPSTKAAIANAVRLPRLQPLGIQLAQSDDAAFRMSQMEEQMRVLNGKVEDMTFQLLQLQEQIRKMQEDNEFRFQELENRGDVKPGNENVAKAGEPDLGKPQPSDPTADNGGSDGEANRKSITELLNKEQNGTGPKQGEPPISLGTLTFDGDGNLVDSNVGKPIDLTGRQPAVDLPDSPDALFDLGYQYVQAGQYDQAEEVFSRHVSDFPDDPKGPEAKFWLGESLFSQGDYEGAAKVFLENHKQNPQAPLARAKSPEAGSLPGRTGSA